MKKCRKPLSILLAVIMALSACVVGFTAFAADVDRDLSTPEKIQEAILADFKKSDGTDNTAAKLKDDVKTAYIALSDGDKDSISGAAITRLFRMSYNSTSGSGATRVANSVNALGGYTSKQQGAIETATSIAGYKDWNVDGTEYKIDVSKFPFDNEYTTGGVTYTVADQIKILNKAMEAYKAYAADSDLLVLIDSIYTFSSYQYFYGAVYFTATDKMLAAASKYLPVANPDASAAEIETMVFNQLGLTDSGAYNVFGTIRKYSDPALTALVENYQASNKDAAANTAFKNAVKPYIDAAAVSYTLDNKIASNKSKIINVNGELKSVDDIWAPVKAQYQTILGEEAVAPIITALNELNLSTIKTSAQVEAAMKTAGFDKLSSAEKKFVQNDKSGIYDKLLKTAYDADTKNFRDSVSSYQIPAQITEANEQAVADKIAEFKALYTGLKSDLKVVYTSTSTLQTYIKNNYANVYSKYEEVLALAYAINLKDLVAAVTAFDLEAEQGTALNEKIAAVKELYVAQDTDTIKYFRSNYADAYTKYNKILTLWAVQPGGEDIHERFTPVVVEAKVDTAPLEGVIYDTLLPKLNEVLGFALPALTGSDSIIGTLETFFVNENVTAFAKMVYPAFWQIVQDEAGVGDMMNTTPKEVGSKLKEEQFANAAAELAKYDTMESWEQVPADLDWGVIPGDYETFVNALLSSLLGVSTSMMMGSAIYNMLVKTFVGSFNATADGKSVDVSTLVPGGWDYFIIPLLEGLGVPSDKIMSNAEYAIATKNDSTIRGILKPLLDIVYYELLPALSADPVGYLLKNLPNLVYHLEDGCIFDGLNKALNNLNMSVLGNNVDIKDILMDLFKDPEGNKPSEITLEMIFDMLAPTLEGLGLSITLDDLYIIGKMGTPEVTDTARVDVPTTVKVTADTDSVANYIVNAISSLIDGLGIDFSVKGEFVKQEAPQYPHNGKMDKDVINAVINGLDGIIGGFINIGDAINNGLCTQEMAANAITAIYGLLNSDGAAGIFDTLNLSFKPSVVAKALTEDKYRELAAALTFTDPALDSWSNVGLVIKNDNTIIDQTDMGFKDGDRQGFVDCLIAALRPVVKALTETGLVLNSEVNGETAYGLYETLIIPMFEALGLTPAANSATVTDNFNLLLKKTDKNGAYDYILKTILAPVMDLLDDLAAAPAATLMKLLPNLAYALQYNPQLAFIGNLLAGDNGKIDLAGMLNGLIGGLLPGFVLPAIDLDALASSGTVVEKNSKSALNEKYTTVAADSADAFVTVFYYLYDAMTYGENMAVVKNLLAGMEGIDETLSSLIDGILNDVFTKGKEEALCAIGTLLASDVWECPDEAGNNGGKTPSTGDYAIPATVFLAMMMTAGGAIFLLKKKKTISAV